MRLALAALALAVAPSTFAQDATPKDPAASPAVIAPLAVRSLLFDVAWAGSRIVVVGERGHILHSADAGGTWVQSPVPASANLTAVYFADEETPALSDVAMRMAEGALVLMDDRLPARMAGGALMESVFTFIGEPAQDVPDSLVEVLGDLERAPVQREISLRFMPLSRIAMASDDICSSATSPRV